ncbi:MAG: hypothetical protein KBD65_03230 [Candidatus Moranbacteria bacterium]|nr:hypothetical protein [Candidatus Moranbacteria bacterium]
MLNPRTGTWERTWQGKLKVVAFNTEWRTHFAEAGMILLSVAPMALSFWSLAGG